MSKKKIFTELLNSGQVLRLTLNAPRGNILSAQMMTELQTELENIDFSPFVKGYNSDSYVYDLYGVCNHSGGSQGGHYTAHIKTADNRWYEFNDTSIREIKTNQVISSRSYCFFFRKKK